MIRVPPEVRQRLDNIRTQQKKRKHNAVVHYMPLIVAACARCPLIRDVTQNEANGSMRFLFQGRRIQYYITTNRLLVCNPMGYTQYIYTPQQMIELILTANNKSFKMVEHDDGELRSESAGHPTYIAYTRHGRRYKEDA